MAENLVIPESSDKKEKYAVIVPQIELLISGEDDLVANMANVAAVLKQVFDFFWVGFYIVKNEELVLGPFQGPLACTRIRYGKGVCGTAWETKKTVVVEDVEKFPGHIACSSLSKSEIVVPIIAKTENNVVAVLDVDSDRLNEFDGVDKTYLEKICELICKKYWNKL